MHVYMYGSWSVIPLKEFWVVKGLRIGPEDDDWSIRRDKLIWQETWQKDEDGATALQKELINALRMCSAVEIF